MSRGLICRAVLLAALAVAPAALLLPGAAAASTKTVTLRDIAFKPGRVTIDKGDRVLWKWDDRDVRHNVTSRSFRSSSSKSTGTYAVTFGRAGTFAYRCTLHLGMNGSVVVRR